MGSIMKTFKARKKNKTRNLGRARKAALQNKGSTPSKAEVFGDSPESTPKG